MLFANQPYTFSALLRAIFKSYFPVLKEVWYLLLTFGTLAAVAALLIKWNLYVGLAISVLLFLVLILLSAMMINLANARLSGQSMSLQDAYNTSKKRYLAILGGFVLLLILHGALQFVVYGLMQLGSLLSIPYLFEILSLLLSFFVLVLFYLAMPMLVLERHQVLNTFGKSVRYSFRNFWHLFAILFCVYFLFAIIFPVVLVGFRFDQPVQLFSWVLLLELIFYPLFIASMLFLLHDSRLHMKLHDAKQDH